MYIAICMYVCSITPWTFLSTACFGPWDLGPQHGFARISKWQLSSGPNKVYTHRKILAHVDISTTKMSDMIIIFSCIENHVRCWMRALMWILCSSKSPCTCVQAFFFFQLGWEWWCNCCVLSVWYWEHEEDMEWKQVCTHMYCNISV